MIKVIQEKQIEKIKLSKLEVRAQSQNYAFLGNDKKTFDQQQKRCYHAISACSLIY